MRRGLCDDRGSASVWAALAAVVLCGVFGAVLGYGQAVHVRHRAGAAADLAALAAADQSNGGPDPACAAARQVARAQGASIVRCAVREEIADLDAQAPLGAVHIAGPGSRGAAGRGAGRPGNRAARRACTGAGAHGAGGGRLPV
ncbi:Rv3654c family TadE-like protein, partial [Streptomyces albus]|uniref:Rv3654c family TadE-like protein n=1 Tax=Streptomyces albus TaxID=1888 RepID=UPI0024E042F4